MMIVLLSPLVRLYQIFSFSLLCFLCSRKLYCGPFFVILLVAFVGCIGVHGPFDWMCMLVWWVHGVFLNCFLFGLSVFVRSGILVSECVLSCSSVSLMPASFDLFLRPVYVCSVDVLSCTVCTGVRVRFPRLVSVLVYCPVYVWTELDWKSGGTAPSRPGGRPFNLHTKKTEQG